MSDISENFIAAAIIIGIPAAKIGVYAIRKWLKDRREANEPVRPLTEGNWSLFPSEMMGSKKKCNNAKIIPLKRTPS